jgi:hypothetical protein
MYYAWKKYEMQTRFWSENLRVRYYSEDVGGDVRMILKLTIEK